MAHDFTAAEVRQSRTQAGMTQAQAAELVNLRRWQTWQDWELGVSPPDTARMRLFRHLTGLEILAVKGTGGAGI